MPSLIPAFNYDIFISYRHNDNRSGWVTEFVKNLQEELAATIKEPVSVYFDSNPHDGLLETHNVDKSLAGKLKCLIFIPIISQTYCDPKSFAWQHEFLVFNKQAKEDPLGRDIKLSNGNVASRILPVRIHDLDAEDKSLIEKELEGVLRPIDFIYKSSGVNRPLKSNDDKIENLNHTNYRDQINKVANAVKEIITALKHPAGKSIENGNQSSSSNQQASLLKNKFAYSVIGLMILLALAYSFSQFRQGSSEEVAMIDKSIAVLPFTDMSPDHDQEFFGDGVAEEIINALTQVNDLKVIARSSSFQFKGKNEDLRNIGDILKVTTVLQGSVRKSNDKLRITAQLIKTSDGVQVWSKTFDRNPDDIFKVQDEIAKAVVDGLKITLSHNLEPTRQASKNSEAYNLYLQGRYLYERSVPGDIEKALSYFSRSIQLDSGFALPWALFSISKWRLNSNASALDWENTKAANHVALELDPNLPDAQANLANFALSEYDVSEAELKIKQALKLHPKNFRTLRFSGAVSTMLGRFDEGIELCELANAIDPIQPISINTVAKAYHFSGRLKEADSTYQKLHELSPSFSGTQWDILDPVLLALARDQTKHLLARLNSETNERIRLAGSAMAFYALGQKESSDTALEKLKEKYAPENAYEIAQVYAFRNETEEAFHWLEQAYRQKQSALVYLKTHPVFKTLRNDSRFKQLLKKMNFPE